jgi:hypothetical protein
MYLQGGGSSAGYGKWFSPFFQRVLLIDFFSMDEANFITDILEKNLFFA